ncbi:conjugal transfer protein TraG [Orientia tsutsugamushi]|uniref:conjugal transfer protein TraG n=1 Tax=Orientia tsutsugamushi TaxID=784 RepID=UPI0035274E0D
MFNGIGRVFASNSEYFTPVGHLALTIGGIWAATRAIFRGNIGIFAMEWFFPSIFIFTLLFAPKATVWLKDEVSMNAPVKVDNIPNRYCNVCFSFLSNELLCVKNVGKSSFTVL